MESIPLTVAALCGLSVATSGDSVQQRVTPDGVTVGHLLDPRTGSPASRELASVTVFAPACLDADAWATAFFVAGAERGMLLAEELGFPALFTLRGAGDDSQRWTSRLAAMMD